MRVDSYQPRRELRIKIYKKIIIIEVEPLQFVLIGVAWSIPKSLSVFNYQLPAVYTQIKM